MARLIGQSFFSFLFFFVFVFEARGSMIEEQSLRRTLLEGFFNIEGKRSFDSLRRGSGFERVVRIAMEAKESRASKRASRILFDERVVKASYKRIYYSVQF